MKEWIVSNYARDLISIKSPLWGEAMTIGSNPTAGRSKQPGTKRHILTDKKGIPLFLHIICKYTLDVKLVIDDVGWITR